MINMEDRFTKLLVDSVQKNLNLHSENGRINLLNLEDVAKDLLNSGVIVPPCKVGDTVYDIHGNPIAVQGMAYSFIYKASHYIEDTSKGYPFFERKTLMLSIEFDDRDVSKTVFLTPEEAEEALREKEK